jgi:hypothetical protein
LGSGDVARNLLNQMSANLALAGGATGFFATRPVLPWLQPGGTIEATSFYDTADLKRTLERLVDFDRLNAGAVRFSVGAVNVRTGNFVYFDTTTQPRFSPRYAERNSRSNLPTCSGCSSPTQCPASSTRCVPCHRVQTVVCILSSAPGV